MSDKVCVVTGVGPGLGAAYARRFAEGGYRVALLGRNQSKLEGFAAEIEGSLPVVCDVGDEAAVKAAFDTIRQELGAPDVVIHNAGSGVFKGFLDTTSQELQSSFDVNVGGLPTSASRDAGKGQRGHHCDRCHCLLEGQVSSPKTAAFAAAKGGQRWLAQALAKEFAPQGVHVSYLIIDGMVDLPRMRELMPSRPPSDFLSPSAVADMAWFLAHQRKEAWTFELDLRPAPEKW